ncbi:hypothetical protein CLV63_101153 [Murinocardiopsis flavida]|uniref:Lipoprotein n=1 Tax=Murinocardiopsis flavida TaxID=645275 RepID=A0A2P8DTY8_9ACTN|nr:hypothetical protein [Murinocardiopsis flavida]PSL00679.1 hypothetical protein CLV63_101153 [Murinocardiopsis flavida]
MRHHPHPRPGRASVPIRIAVAALAAATMIGCTPTADPGKDGQQTMETPSESASAAPPGVPGDADHPEERRRVVRELWESGSRDTARIVASPESMHVKTVENDVLPKEWELLLFQGSGPHSAAIYAAVGPRESTILLSRRPEGYAKLADTAEIRVDSADKAMAVTEFFLDKTRDLSVHQFFLRGPDDAELSRFGDVSKAEDQIARAVKKPVVTERRKGYQVVAFVQRADRIERWKGTVTGDGKVSGTFTPVITDLPVDTLR